MVSKLHRRGIEAVSVHENGRYVVRAGSFSSKDRAARQLAKVKSSGFPAIIK
jgi:cell division protein FtsN